MLLESARARVAGKLLSVPKGVSCYEAGYDSLWLHRLLNAAGIANLLFDPTSIAVERRSRWAKTDRIDASCCYGHRWLICMASRGWSGSSKCRA